MKTKNELFSYVTKHFAIIPTEKQVITTCGPDVLCNHSRDISNLGPCNQEEDDSRMMLHTSNAVHQRFKIIVLRTVDTDVVVLAVPAVPSLHNTQLYS